MKKLIPALKLGSFTQTSTLLYHSFPCFVKAPSTSSIDSAGAPTARLSINRSRMGNIFLGGSKGNNIFASSSFPLLTRGSFANFDIASFIPLYTKGYGFNTTNIDLFTKGMSTENSNITLYMKGGTNRFGSMNLFTRG